MEINSKLMTRVRNIWIIALSGCLSVISCRNENHRSDASGTFEATETIVSSESSGKIMQFNVSEGDQLKEGQQVGYTDTTQLYLSKLQLLQNKKAILSGKPDIQKQVEALQKELENAESDKKRIENLVRGQVASQKQLDDANERIAVLQARIEAQQSALGTTTRTLTEQSGTVAIQLAQIEDQLRKCRIINPLTGTVLATYANAFEMTSPGKPLYKIADLSVINLRVYVSGGQLPLLKINQQLRVLTDDGKGGYKETKGVISWINDKAEFTPKTIQTKDERANLVYAIKVRVKNDGSYKIGMYGEVKFQ